MVPPSRIDISEVSKADSCREGIASSEVPGAVTHADHRSTLKLRRPQGVRNFMTLPIHLYSLSLSLSLSPSLTIDPSVCACVRALACVCVCVCMCVCVCAILYEHCVCMAVRDM